MLNQPVRTCDPNFWSPRRVLSLGHVWREGGWRGVGRSNQGKARMSHILRGMKRDGVKADGVVAWRRGSVEA